MVPHPTCRLSVLALSIAVPASALAQDRVGTYADRIVVRGCVGANPLEVEDALRGHPEWDARADEFGLRAELLLWIDRELTEGFADNGWPHAEVDVTTDPELHAIVIDVEEGPRIEVGAIVVDGADAIAASEVRAAVAEDWREPGKAGRWGTAGLESAWRQVERLYASRGRAHVRGLATMREREDGDADLVLRINDEGPELEIARIEFGGEFSDDPERIVERAGIVTGAASRGTSLEDLQRRILAIGRYASVRLDASAERRGVLDPLRIELTQVAGGPSWDDVDWDEMAAFRATAARLREELPGTRCIEFRASFDEIAPLESSGVCGSDSACIEFEGVTSEDGHTESYSLVLVDGHVTIAAHWPRERARIPFDFPPPGLRLAMTPRVDGGIQILWGIGVSSSVARSEIAIHDAAYHALCVNERRAVDDGVVEFHSERGTILTWNREDQEVSVRSDAIAIRFPLDACADRVRDRLAEIESYEEVGAGELIGELLVRLTESEHEDSRLCGAACRAAWAWLQTRSFRNVFPDFHLQHPDPRGWIPRVVGLWSNRLAHAWPARTWPWILVRTIPRLLSPSEASLKAVRADYASLDSSTLGPIACWLWAELFHRIDRAEHGRRFARVGLERFDVTRAWKDVVALCPAGTSARALLEQIGRTWREDGFGIPPETSDLGAAGLGVRRLLEGRAGESLRARLEELAD